MPQGEQEGQILLRKLKGLAKARPKIRSSI